MSTATETTERTETTNRSWRAGILGGILGALVMGALILAMNEPTLAVAIPSLYTLAPPPNVAAGLFVHVSHGAVLGLLFAAIVGALGFDTPVEYLGVGVAWGAATWAGFAALVMPVWLGAVGSPASPPFPNFAPPSLLWHLAYGVVLAGAYTALVDRL